MERLAAAVREHLGHEAQDIAQARQRLESDRERIESTIASLLDNMSAETRDIIEGRLGELRVEREQLKIRVAELERFSLQEAEAQDTVQEVGAFIAGLDHVLATHANEQRIAALRRCIEQLEVDAVGISRKLTLRSLPMQSSGACLEALSV